MLLLTLHACLGIVSCERTHLNYVAECGTTCSRIRSNRMMALANPIKRNASRKGSFRPSHPGRKNHCPLIAGRPCEPASGHPEFILCNFGGYSSSRNSKPCPIEQGAGCAAIRCGKREHPVLIYDLGVSKNNFINRYALLSKESFPRLAWHR